MEKERIRERKWMGLTNNTKSEEAIYDIAIIGGGPGGYVAAIRAAQLGAKVVLFEKEQLGGTCLNKGCIPTKTFLKSVKAFRELKKLPDLGITGIESGEGKIDFEKLLQRKQKVVARLTAGVASLLQAHGVEVIRGKAVMDEQPDLIKVNGQTYQARNVILATGSRPKSLPLPGIESAAVMSSDEALSLEKAPASLVILGGGVIGVEFALIFRELGAEVAIVEMAERLLPNMDEELAIEAAKVLKNSRIALYTGAKALAIKNDRLIFEKSGETRELAGEKILVAVGRRPVYDDIAVEKLGIRTEKGAIVTDEFLRTTVPQIYAIGDVNGKYMLAHKASAEGLVAVANIFGKQQKMDYHTVPQCVYSSPEIASVGLSEQQAREKYCSGAKQEGNAESEEISGETEKISGETEEIMVGKFPLVANGKAQLEGETRGFVKVITEKKTNKLLGVHIVSAAATELIAEAVTVLQLGASAEELVGCIHPHPTISEAVQEAYFAVLDGAIHFAQKK